MDLDIGRTAPAQAPIVARNWARRIEPALNARFAPGHQVSWWAPEQAQGAPYVQWLDVLAGERLEGRIRVRWDPARAGSLGVDATAEGLPVQRSVVADLCNLLGLLGAVGALGLWVWFAIADWSRVWNRLASTFGAAREDSATKLEVGWLLVGWAVGPVFVGLGFSLLGNRFRARATARRARAVEAFGRRELDGLIATVVEEGRGAAAEHAQTAADLGLS